MLRLLKYIRPYRKAALAAPLLMAVEVASDLLQPILMAQIVDRGIAGGDLGLIVRTSLLMISIVLVGVGGGIGCMIFSSRVAQSFGADLRRDLFRQTQSFSFANLDRFKTASLITRLTNDVVQVQNMVLMSMRILVRAPLLSIGGLIMAIAIDPELAMILVAAVPLLIGALALVITKGFPLYKIVQQKLDKVNSVVQENLSGIRVVKSFVRGDFENSRFGAANDRLTEISKRASRTVGMVMPLMMLIMNMSIVAVLWFGGIKVNTGGIQLGQVIAFISYLTQILFALMIMAFMLMSVSRAKVSAERIFEVMDTDVDITDGKEEAKIREGLVEFRNVSFQYRGAAGEPVLKNISFTAHPGETVGILGATGSGKTTLVNLIPRFYDVSSGQILLDGIDIRNFCLADLRTAIGMVLQETILFSGTVEENLKWGRSGAGPEEIREAARAAQADDFISNLPQGYQTVLGQRGVNLSGGQKQRLAIARAIIKKPAVLIFDDSTSALDLGTESRLRQALRGYIQNATCFIIAQRITSVMDADEILVLEDGEIVACGRHDDLLKNCPLYQDIYGSQMGEEAV